MNTPLFYYCITLSEEWINTCHEAIEAINETKTKNWKDLLQDAMPNSDNPKCRKSSKVWMLLLIPTHQMKQYPTTVVASPTWNPSPTFSYTFMPGSANLICHELINISTINSQNVSAHHLLTLNKWVSYYLLSKEWSAKEQWALTIFHFHFLSHLVLWFSRNYYPYSTHPFLMLILHVSRGFP